MGASHLVANIGGSRDYDAAEIVETAGRVLGRELTSAPTRRGCGAPTATARRRLLLGAGPTRLAPETSLEAGLRIAVRQPLAAGVEVE